MDSWDVLAQASDLVRNGEAFALATVVWRQGPSSSKQGCRAIITASGELRGWIGGACAEPAVIREAREVIAAGSARLLLLGSPDQFGAAVPAGMTVVPISCQSEGALEVYIEPVVPAPSLIVIGRSPMARTLTDLARDIGWQATLIAVEDFTAAAASARSLVVVATQGHGDETAIEQAAAANPAYLGLVGSRRRGAAVLGYLADRGVPADQLARVRVPAGLDLGPTSHQEIAVAILAELVQLRAAGELGGSEPASPADLAGSAASAATAGRRRDDGAGTGADQGGASAQATDPVCGMAVPATVASLPLEHGGGTYYFCQSGCRSEFERNPAAYVKEESRC